MGNLICAAFGLSLFASALALYLSAWPGTLSELAFNAMLLWPLLVLPLVAALVGVVILLRRWPPSGRIRRWQWPMLGAIPLILVGSLATIDSGLPFRWAFRLARPGLESRVSAAPTCEYGGRPLRRHFGPYLVDEYGADPRGGVYFRVMTRPDFVDRMSYGFAFRPNHEGTPFGRARYRVDALGGDWYWFQASDDSY